MLAEAMRTSYGYDRSRVSACCYDRSNTRRQQQRSKMERRYVIMSTEVGAANE